MFVIAANGEVGARRKDRVGVGADDECRRALAAVDAGVDVVEGVDFWRVAETVEGFGHPCRPRPFLACRRRNLLDGDAQVNHVNGGFAKTRRTHDQNAHRHKTKNPVPWDEVNTRGSTHVA